MKSYVTIVLKPVLGQYRAFSLFVFSFSFVLLLLIGCGKETTDTTPPAEVSGLNAILNDGQVTLNWTDPADDDFKKVKITYTPGGNTATEIVKGIQTLIITGLTNGTEYTFTVKTVDTGDNESTGIDSEPLYSFPA